MSYQPSINQTAAIIRFPEVVFGAEPAVLNPILLAPGFVYRKGYLIGSNQTFTTFKLYDSTDVSQVLYGVLYDDWVNNTSFLASQTPFTLTGAIATSTGNLGGTNSVAFTGNTATSTTISGININTNLLSIGATVVGSGIPTGATIATIVSSSSITISVATTATATGVSIVSTVTGIVKGNIPGNNSSNPYPALSVITGSSIDTSTLTIGALITGTGIPLNSTIVNILSSTAFVISANVTATNASVTLSTYAVQYGQGLLNVATTQNATTQFVYTALVGANGGTTDIDNFLAANPTLARKINRYNGQLSIPVVTFNVIG